MPGLKRTTVILAAAFSAATFLYGDTEAGLKAFRAKDYAIAYKEFKAASDQGDAAAQFNLGLMFARGVGVKQDLQEAMRLYHESALQGNAMAQYRLGFRYAHGWGVQQDYAEATSRCSPKKARG
jgi:TPR repeat protein